MTTILQQYVKTSVELHHKLNDVKYMGDVNAEYTAFFNQYASLRGASNDALCPHMQLSLHDCQVQNLSSRKHINDYFIQFSVNALHFKDGREVNYVHTFFTIESKQKLREINGRELYDIIIDETAKEILFMFWVPGRLQSLIVPYSFLRIEYAM